MIQPTPHTVTHATLQAVATISATDVWAVGYGISAPSTVQQPLIQHWNGCWWNVVSNPHVGSGSATGTLAGVAAVGKTNVWAVGYVTNPGMTSVTTLVEHWNGSSWSVVPSPNATDGYASQLHSVVAVSANDVWALGYWIDPSGYEHTLAEHWNGSSWSIVPTPDASSRMKNCLVGVAAISASNVWAVGYSSNIQGYLASTLTEQWNGSQWAIVPSADTGGSPADYLYGMAAVAAGNIWTVGFTTAGIAPSSSQTLVEQWNGNQWSIVSSPSITNTYSALASVAAISASDVWAVGSDEANSSPYATSTLIEEWTGSQWSIVPSPNASWSLQSSLAGVAGASATDVWAVGAAGGYTLVEHWNGSQWQIVPSP